MVNGVRPVFALLLFSASLALTPLAGKGQTPAQTPQNEVLQRFRAGQVALRAGRWNVAVEEFKKVLQLKPDLIEAQVNLGLAYHALGDYNLAVSELSEAAKMKPNLLPANLFLGISYLKLGSPDKAIIPLNRVVHIDPSNRVARRALAMAELSVGHYGEAARLFRRLASDNPDGADRWFTLGEDYLHLSKLLTADLSAQFARSVWSYRLAGDILRERQLWNDAASAYRKALEAGPAPQGLHADLGMTLLAAHKTEDAASEFQAELAHTPYDRSALLGIAEIELLKGNVSAALEQIELIWKSEPDALVQAVAGFPSVNFSQLLARKLVAEMSRLPAQPPQMFLQAAMFQILGDTARAHQIGNSLETSATALTASLEKQGLSRSDCEHQETRLCAEFLASQKNLKFGDLLRLGRNYLVLGQTKSASDAFARAVQQDRKNAEAVYWLNRSYLLLSEECFNQLMVSYPNSWRTYELEAEALHLRQADQEAMKEYRIAEKLNPGNPKIHEALGEILLDQRNFAEAKSELGTALHLDPASARGLYLMGRLYVDQREPAKGIPYLESALRRDPSLLEARPVLGRAYLKAGKPALAIPQLVRSSGIDRYGDLHYQLYEAYRQEGKTKLAAQALARSQQLRRQSVVNDQAKIRSVEQ